MSSYTFDKVDPEEIIEKLEKLIIILENKKLSQKVNNEEKLSNPDSS